ncbi:MAG: hypothetical protein JNK70_04860, partial [Phycisphaerae bacterium]|nr:hypothetical protein [Phycisphaerae bacterium]
ILSMLVYNGLITPEMLVCVAESNPAIRRDGGYVFTEPPLAVTPSKAVWDPGLSGMPGEAGMSGLPSSGRRGAGAIGHTSYAHLPPFGRRARQWSSTFDSRVAIIANRGPLYGGTPGRWVLAPGPEGTESFTLRIHGSPMTWAGNAAFNDGHVDFLTRPDPEQLRVTYTQEVNGTRNHYDNIFTNEDDRRGTPVMADSQPDRNENNLLRAYGDVQSTASSVTITPLND